MPYIYLIVSVFMSASTSVLGKLYNQKIGNAKDSGALYNFILLATVFLGWGILFLLDFSFHATVLIYALLFGIFYTIGMAGAVYALKYGSAVLTALFISLSLIGTTIWGFFFWGAEWNAVVAIGLVLVVVAIYLCLNAGQREEKAFSWKWLLFALMAAIGNAGCSIVQRTQQMQYSGLYGNMMMFFAVGIGFLFCLLLYLKSDKRDSVLLIKRAGWVPLATGACNLVINLFMMILVSSSLSTSLIYPVISVGSLMVVAIFSLFFFKEKLSKSQWVGIVVGTVAVALLSI